MKASVIIPTRYRLEDLKVTLASICDNDAHPSEVIIVDQSATARGPELDALVARKGRGRDMALRYFHETGIKSVLEARDFGVGKSSGDVILFLDDDITLFPDFFRKLAKTFEDYPGLDAVCAADTLGERLSLPRLIARNLFWLGPFYDNRSFVNKFHARLKGPVKTTKFSAGYMACKRIVYETIGFDRALTGHVFVGDIDFSYRASKKFGLALCPELKVMHRGGSPLYDTEAGDFKRVHSRMYFFRKNVDKTVLNYMAFAWLMAGTFAGSLARCIQLGSVKPVKGFMKGLGSVS